MSSPCASCACGFCPGRTPRNVRPFFEAPLAVRTTEGYSVPTYTLHFICGERVIQDDCGVVRCSGDSHPLVLLAVGTCGRAYGDTVITFEGFPDSTILTNQYPGLTFTNAIILSAGISLNEFEFPPHSGTNVAVDNGGPITIDFARPVTSFGGYFTYLEPLTLAAFNASDLQVITASSAFSSNDALFGDTGSSPNEFIDVSAAGGISSVTITGDPGAFRSRSMMLRFQGWHLCRSRLALCCFSAGQ